MSFQKDNATNEDHSQKGADMCKIWSFIWMNQKAYYKMWFKTAQQEV